MPKSMQELEGLLSAQEVHILLLAPGFVTWSRMPALNSRGSSSNPFIYLAVGLSMVDRAPEGKMRGRQRGAHQDVYNFVTIPKTAEGGHTHLRIC